MLVTAFSNLALISLNTWTYLLNRYMHLLNVANLPIIPAVPLPPLFDPHRPVPTGNQQSPSPWQPFLPACALQGPQADSSMPGREGKGREGKGREGNKKETEEEREKEEGLQIVLT